MKGLKPFDIVALLVDSPESGLRRGDVGTVVKIFESTKNHPGGYLVEFVNEKGGTMAELSVTDPELIMKLNFKLNAVIALPERRQLSEGEREEALAKLLRYAGAVSSGNPRSADNEQIDADLAREYGRDL
jgi:hypothetical protein